MSTSKRHTVLELCILFETAVSESLCFLLDINKKTSKAFGNSSHSLSFSNKLTLLSDINIIDKKDRLKFDHFSAIRNQFAHNIDAIDFISCFSFIEMEKQLTKLYKNVKEETDKEQFCENLFYELYADLLGIYQKVIEFCKSKSFNKGSTDANQTLFENLIKTLQEFAEKDSLFYNQMVEIFKTTADKTKEQLNSLHNNPVNS